MPEFRLDEKTRTDQATALMTAFAERTGLTGKTSPVRYLWTDAFAVCNFVGLERVWKDGKFLDFGRRLIEQVHETLGRHRNDDARNGWISGLPDEEGKKHPTTGGLRIGKRLPERGPDDPFDEYLEWERDGQYFHYLTKWMHALDIMARETGERQYGRWALELAEAAWKAFVFRHPAGGGHQMCWKMSTDLSRPLVNSMGFHDPLDGFIKLLQLRATVRAMQNTIDQQMPFETARLEKSLRAFYDMVMGRDWTTSDPLGLGGLLSDAVCLAQIIQQGAAREIDLLAEMLGSAQAGLRLIANSGMLAQPASQRLAFRELGLAIGLQGFEWMQAHAPMEDDVQHFMNELSGNLPIAEQIVDFWTTPETHASLPWTEHLDINTVMLATALLPLGFLRLKTI